MSCPTLGEEQIQAAAELVGGTMGEDARQDMLSNTATHELISETAIAAFEIMKNNDDIENMVAMVKTGVLPVDASDSGSQKVRQAAIEIYTRDSQGPPVPDGPLPEYIAASEARIKSAIRKLRALSEHQGPTRRSEIRLRDAQDFYKRLRIDGDVTSGEVKAFYADILQEAESSVDGIYQDLDKVRATLSDIQQTIELAEAREQGGETIKDRACRISRQANDRLERVYTSPFLGMSIPEVQSLQVIRRLSNDCSLTRSDKEQQEIYDQLRAWFTRPNDTEESLQRRRAQVADGMMLRIFDEISHEIPDSLYEDEGRDYARGELYFMKNELDSLLATLGDGFDFDEVEAVVAMTDNAIRDYDNREIGDAEMREQYEDIMFRFENACETVDKRLRKSKRL